MDRELVDAVGVRHQPYPVPRMRSADGARGYTIPLRIEADLSQGPENLIQSASAKGCNVFDDRPAWLGIPDEPEGFPPQTRPFAAEPDPLAGETDVLAWEAAA